MDTQASKAISANQPGLRHKEQQTNGSSIFPYLSAEAVIFLNADTRDETLLQMIALLDRLGKLHNREVFHEAILEREQLVSTGIGMGVAIPHAKLPGYEEFFIGIGIQQNGVAWNAIDGGRVRLIFMIGGPDDKQTEYLRILSKLTLAVKDEERRKKLLQCQLPREVIELFDSI